MNQEGLAKYADKHFIQQVHYTPLFEYAIFSLVIRRRIMWLYSPIFAFDTALCTCAVCGKP